MQEKSLAKVSRLLDQAERSAGQGERDHAYQYSLKATDLAPNDARAWYLRSQSAISREERLVCLSRVYALDPRFPRADGEIFLALKELLEQDPSLTYVHETKDLYQVKSGSDLLINVPKNRAHEELFIKRPVHPLKPAFDWLNVALVALFLGGLGAFLLAPVAVVKIFQQQRQLKDHADRVRLRIVVILSILIWFLSIPLSLLFVIHFLAWGA